MKILATFSSLALFLPGEPLALFPETPEAFKQSGPGKFTVEQSIATATGGMGLWWYAQKEFANACLEIEFFPTKESDNSGVFVRFPDPANDPWVAVHQGYEIQIAGDGSHKNHTGAIYDIQPGIDPKVKIGDWNTYQIITAGPHIAVILNDRLVNIFQCQAGRGDTKGYFGLQNHDDESPVKFRAVRVHELSSPSLLEAFDELAIPRATLIQYHAEAAKLEADKKTPWYQVADHGPAFFQTFGDWFQGKERRESAIKGIALSYSALPGKVALFNTETLALLSATDQGLNLINTPWGGGHGKVNQFLNQKSYLFNTSDEPVWQDPAGSTTDQRPIKGHGNFDHLKFRGSFRHGQKVILDYAVNGTQILDHLRDHPHGLVRHLEVAPHDSPLTLRLADDAQSPDFQIKLAGESARLAQSDSSYLLRLEPNAETTLITLLYTPTGQGDAPAPLKLSDLTTGGPGISPESFEVQPTLDSSENPWLVDQIPLPPALQDSPYLSKVRLSDLDFFSDGDRALLPTWDGDIWLLSGLKGFTNLTWKRYATGFFEPLGLKIVNDVPYVAGRDGIYKIHDLNGDHEADHFEVFNNEVYLTNNFHEFQFGLETDSEGNFYFAKASPVRPGGRGFDKILPHNGIVAKISADGSKFETIATGLRAPGGIGIGPNGEFTTGENEGTWQPCCKINYSEPSENLPFFGVEDARHDNPTPYTEPLCYLPMNVDNSGGSQIWVEEKSRFGIAPGELLHLSYGQSAIYHVLRQKIRDGFYQGGVVKLPVKLSSSAQRAVFHHDGSLYVVGFRGWQTNAAQEAGLQRIRFNPDAQSPLPKAMEVTKEGVKLTFSVVLDEELATDPASFTAERWKYIRSAQYGSGHFSVDQPDLEAEKSAREKESKNHRKQDKVKILAAKLLPDQKSILLTIEGHKPSEQFKLNYDLESADGEAFVGTIHSTIHEIPKP